MGPVRPADALWLFERRLACRRMSRLFADRDRVLPALALRGGIRNDDGAMERLPIVRRQLSQLFYREALKELLRVDVLADRLDLKEGNVASEFNRDVGLENPDVIEQGTEPIIGLDDAFQHLIRQAVRKVRHPANKQAPARRRLGNAAGPD